MRATGITVIVACVATGALLIALMPSGAEAPDGIPFPDAYRNWAHVKTVIVGPESAAFATDGGMHHIYANTKALEGYATGRFPDGAIIVYDLLETVVVNGNTIEGAQRRIDVMIRDSRRSATGGWSFGSFRPDERRVSRLTADQQAACFVCHGTRADTDGVFSRFRT